MLVDCWIRKHLVLEMITLQCLTTKLWRVWKRSLNRMCFPKRIAAPPKTACGNTLDMQTEGALLLLSVCSSGKPDLIGQDLLIALQPFLTDANNVTQKSYHYGLKY